MAPPPPPSRRRGGPRAAAAPPQEEPLPTPLESLQRFLSEAGVTVSDAIEIREERSSSIGAAAAASTSSNCSLRVVASASAAPSIPAGTLLATIPKGSAVLSARNSVASGALEAERIGGGLALLLATLAEAALGDRSRFCHYLRSLPPRGEYLPVLWPPGATRELLRGTSLSPEAVEKDRERVEEDWREEAVPFARKHAPRLLGLKKSTKDDLLLLLTAPGGPFSLDAFFKVATWAASRAFGVDDDHGQALVPLADAFNHGAKVVKLSSSSSSSSRSAGGEWNRGGFEVERACLELSEEEDDDGEEEEEEEEEEESSESEEEEGEECEDGEEGDGDDRRREQQQQQQKVSAPPRGDGMALDIAICGCDDSGEASLAIYAASELGAFEERGDEEEGEGFGAQQKKGGVGVGGRNGGGQSRAEKKKKKKKKKEEEEEEEKEEGTLPRPREIFNCYGELGNRELLSKYGFCLPLGRNPFDAVPLRPALLLSALEERAAGAAAATAKAAAKAKAGARRRARWLRESSDLLDDEDGDDLAVTAGGGERGGEEEEGEDERERKRSKGASGGRGAPAPPFVVPTLSPSLRATLTVLCASREEAASWDDGGGDGEGLQVALAPAWWRGEQGVGKEGAEGVEDKKRKRKRPPMLGPLPLTAAALRGADPALPSPLALEVLSGSLSKRIEEYGPEPDYEKVLASWGEGEKEGGRGGDDGDGGDGGERRARAERAVRATSLLRRGELFLLRRALEATRALLEEKV